MHQFSARRRAAVMRWHAEHGRNVSATCRHFGIGRATFYRWRARYDPERTASLKPRSRRPHWTRQPLWTEHHLARVADLSARFPAYGKRRLHRVLAGDGVDLSEATVGRLLGIVRAGCPACGGKHGQHHGALHALRHDVGPIVGDQFVRRRPASRRPEPRPRSARLPSGPEAVRSVEKLLGRPPE